MLAAFCAVAGLATRAEEPAATNLVFIDTSFENASPVWYDPESNGLVRVHLLYDHERGAPNRAAGHLHILVNATPGAKLNFEFTNLENIYNGRPGSVAREMRALVTSEDGRTWKPVATEVSSNTVKLTVDMPGPKLFIARTEPYRISDLDRFLAEIRTNQLVQIETIGRTVQGRDLEIVHVGRTNAPYRAFVRARAHPWESGPNWVVEGLVRRLLRGDADAERFLQSYRLFVLPMANKDGVARGLTRFNASGRDLNRDWNRPADPRLAPENAALETWLDRQIRAGAAPQLALELHNDGSGHLHISQPDGPGALRHLDRMKQLEALLREHTWFTEGATRTSHGSSTLAAGWIARFGIDAAVHEFNCQWVAGRSTQPTAKLWVEYGEGLARVFHEYFGAVKP